MRAYLFEVFRDTPSPRWHRSVSREDPRKTFGDTLVRNVREMIPIPELTGSYAADGGTLAVNGQRIALAIADTATWREHADFLCVAGNQYKALREERVKMQDENEMLRNDLRNAVALLTEVTDAYDIEAGDGGQRFDSTEELVNKARTFLKEIEL